MESIVVAISFQGKPVVTIIEEPEPIRGGVELAIVPYILYLSTKLVKVPIVVFSIQVEVLEEFVTPKHVTLVLLEIGTCIMVTLIDSVTHASKVLKTLNTILEDTHVMDRLDPQLIHLLEPIDTTCE
jgi:hypothetical protein